MSTTSTDTHITLQVKTVLVLQGNINDGVRFTDDAGDPPNDWGDNPADFVTQLSYPGTLTIKGRNFNSSNPDPNIAERRIWIKELRRKDPNQGYVLLDHISIVNTVNNNLVPNKLTGDVVDASSLPSDAEEDYNLIINIKDKDGNLLGYQKDGNTITDIVIDPKMRMRSRGSS